MPSGNTTTTGENTAGPLTGAEWIRGVQSGGNVKMTTQDIANLGYTSPTTAKGDLIVHGVGADVRLPIGANGAQLVADSSQPMGVKWYDSISALLATLATYLGTTMLGFLQAGTGAVLRTAQSKLRDVISVRDFGAVGDGTTNDTAAIQAAINSVSTVSAGAGPSGAVYFPAGQYKITSAILLPYGVSIYGDGGNASVLRCYDCDGIRLTEQIEDDNMQFIRDVGMFAMSGTNRTGILANTGSYPTSQNDGFYIERVQVSGFDVGVLMVIAWQSYIDRCLIRNVNTGISIGGNATLITVSNNQIVRESGGLGSASNVAVITTGVNTEANKIFNNFLYGFATAISLQQPWECSVFCNTILTSNTTGGPQIGITFNTVLENLHIYDNIFETTSTTGSSVIGIYGSPLNSSSGGHTVIQNNRIVDDNGLGTGIGIQINSSGLTNQNDVIIQNNSVSGFSTYDLVAYNPKYLTVKNNKFESVAPTISLYISGTCVGPIFVDQNWSKAANQFEATYLANGTIITSNNVAGGTFSPVPIGGSWSPVDASGAGLTFTVAQAIYYRVDKLFVVQCDITWPTTTNSSNASIGGMPAIPNGTYTGAISYSTVGTWSGGITSASTATFGLYDAAGVPRTNAAMSGKRIIVSFSFATA